MVMVLPANVYPHPVTQIISQIRHGFRAVAKSKIAHPSSGDLIHSPNHNFRWRCTEPLGCQLLDFRSYMLQCFLGRLYVGIHSAGFPSSPHAYAEAKKIKTLPACIHNMSLFLIQLEAQIIENPPYPFQYPVGVASA
jgi:hypothetical protein